MLVLILAGFEEEYAWQEQKQQLVQTKEPGSHQALGQVLELVPLPREIGGKVQPQLLGQL